MISWNVTFPVLLDMDLANYGSSGSESEEDSAELEAHLYSRIYYDNDSQDQTTSLKLYEVNSFRRQWVFDPGVRNRFSV